MTTYLCDFLPGANGEHSHDSQEAANSCRNHWKKQREAKAKGYVDHSPHREPAIQSQRFY
jgi:hypothetical protein